MIFNKKMILNTFITTFFLTCLLAVPGVAISQDFAAILVVHGSNDPNWNRQVEDFYRDVAAEEPSLRKLAFLYFGDENRKLENVVEDLKGSNVKEFLFVHLSPSSHSIRHREIKTRVSPLLEPPLQYKISPALDDHRLAIEILKQQAGQLSVNPGTESLILVGYGPIEESENDAWENQLNYIGERIKQELNFRDIVCMNLRYHAWDKKRAKAIKRLRQVIRPLINNGRVIVVPYVLCDGNFDKDSFQKDLQDYLRGVDRQNRGNMKIGNKGFISHPNTKQWVKEFIRLGMSQPEGVISLGIAQPEIVPVNSPWSAMDALKKVP